jgi:OOP family OmpA-OmpF porin
MGNSSHIHRINFDFDKSDIRPEFVLVLDEAVEILKASPDLNVIIEGHTCWIETEKYNQGLSERRATSEWVY